MYGIILAAGRGERMGHLTDNTPKPMLRINDKPILQYQIEQLKAGGITNIMIVEKYLSKVIKDYFKDGKEFGVKIDHLVIEGEKGSAGALREALQSIPEQEKDVVLMYGDIFSDVDIARLLKKHQETGENDATLLEVNMDNLIPNGIIDAKDIDEDGIFKNKGIEKPSEVGMWGHGAIFALNRNRMLKNLPESGDLSKDVWARLYDTLRLGFYNHEGYWRNMTSPSDLSQVEKDIKHRLSGVNKENNISPSTSERK